MFDFFGLCRELRDHIFEEALVTETRHNWKEGVQARVQKYAATNLLLVSHQFKDEYAAAARRCCTITMDDCSDGMPPKEDTDPIIVPQILRTARNIDFELWMICEVEDHDIETCECIFQLEHHRGWINGLLSQMSALTSVHVAIFLHFESHVQDCVEFLADFGAGEVKQIEPLTSATVVVPVVKNWRNPEDVDVNFRLVWDRETQDFLELPPEEGEIGVSTGQESNSDVGSMSEAESDGSDDSVSSDGDGGSKQDEDGGSEE